MDLLEPHPNSESRHPQISLNRWWQGHGGRFTIKNEAEWRVIIESVEKFGRLIGWTTGAAGPHGRSTAAPRNAPNGVADAIARDVDLASIPPHDYQRFLEVVQASSEVFNRADDGFTSAFSEVVARLPKQREQALTELSDLLESWSLHQVTGVTREVKARLGTLALFKARIEDDATYEIRGDNSIHRILESAMWMLDENYWLLQSNSTLRTFIGDSITRKEKGGNLRPDFVCGSVGDKLIIIEIKRPSRQLREEDLNQLEDYFVAAEGFSTTFKSTEGYLVGKSVSPDLLRRLKHRRGKSILTYSDLVHGAERRYKGYLKFLETPD